jgi:hypothetical protein
MDVVACAAVLERLRNLYSTNSANGELVEALARGSWNVALLGTDLQTTLRVEYARSAKTYWQLYSEIAPTDPNGYLALAATESDLTRREALLRTCITAASEGAAECHRRLAELLWDKGNTVEAVVEFRRYVNDGLKGVVVASEYVSFASRVVAKGLLIDGASFYDAALNAMLDESLPERCKLMAKWQLPQVDEFKGVRFRLSELQALCAH